MGVRLPPPALRFASVAQRKSTGLRTRAQGFDSSRGLSNDVTPWPRGEARACKARRRRFESARCLSKSVSARPPYRGSYNCPEIGGSRVSQLYDPLYGGRAE